MGMMAILLIAIFLYATNIISYGVGVKHGRVIKNGGTPNINPVEAIRANKKKKEYEKKHDEFAEGLKNVLNFGND